MPLAVLVLIVAFGSQSLHHDAMSSLVGDRDLKTVQTAARSLEKEIEQRGSYLSLLAGSELVPDSREIPETLRTEIQNIFDYGMTIITKSGEVISAEDPQAWLDFQKSQPEFIKQFISNGPGPHYLSVSPSNSNSPAIIYIGFKNDRNQIYIGAFSLESMLEEIALELSGSGQTAILLIAPPTSSSHFDILFQAGEFDSSGDHANHTGITEVLSGKSGVAYLHTETGEHVVAYAPVQSVGWGLVMDELWEDIASPYLSSTQSAPLVIVPVFILAILAILFGARRIVIPLQNLEKQSARLADGDFEAIHKPVGGILEIRNLQAKLVEMAENLSTAQQGLRGYIGAITAGVENERRNLARELHDDTIQSLIALNQRLQILEMQTKGSEKELAGKALTLIQQSLNGLRRLIRGLRPVFLDDLGLVATLEMLAREVKDAQETAVNFSSSGTETRLHADLEMALYRMIQESLANVSRHARATMAWVEMDWQENCVTVSIRDDGRGFEVPENLAGFASQGHFGLLGLHERAELIHADLEIISAPDQGTEVIIHLPFRAHQSC